MTNNGKHLAYLPEGVTFTPLRECPWCSSTSIFRIAIRGDGLPVMRCPECHLAFLGELPDDLSVFYDEGYFTRSPLPNSDLSDTGYENYDRSYSPSSFRWLSMLIRAAVGPEKKRLFDLGSATGTFLEAARLEGFVVSGSELHERAAAAAREKGLDVRGGPFDPRDWDRKSFDVVTALEVLEHVNDIRTTVLDLVSLLRDDGLLVFFVPILSDSALAQYGDAGSDFQAHYEHTFYLNPTFLERMSEELFGENHLVLWVPEVEELGQIVSYGLGFLRPFSEVGPPERRLIHLMSAESLEAMDGLSVYEATAIALTASKMYDFPTAEAALYMADRMAGPQPMQRIARAQVLRSRGELLSAIAILEDVIAAERSQDPMATALLIETVEDLLTLMRIERSGLSGGLRELHERFEDMRARLAEGDPKDLRTALRNVIEMLKAQLEVAEQLAKNSVEMLDESRKHGLSLESNLAEISRELSGERAMATELGNENARLRNDLNDIYLSRAWRLVSRLRSVIRMPSRALSRFRGTPSTGHDADVTASQKGRTRVWQPPVESYPFLVSVIMPVYNKGTTLRSSIESVRAQTLTPIEIVIWDDGSGDPETLAVLDDVSNLSGVTLFRASNQGVVGARNSAIALSRGRYICCLDPDDQIAPTYLEMAVALLESQPQYAIAYPWVHSTGDADELWETQDLEPSLITRANHVPVCALFRREVFYETGGFSPEMTHGYEDWEFWVHAAELGFRGKSIPAHLFKYRFSRDATESRDAKARESHQQLIDEIAQLHPRLARTGVPLDRPTPTTVRPVGRQLGPRQLPAGAGRPVVMTLPWFTVGGADRVVDLLVRKWVSDGHTVVVFTTTPLAPGMSDRRHDLDVVTPYVYPLNDFLPVQQWYEFVATTIAALDSPVLFNVGSAWLHENGRGLRRDFPHLRMVDQQFNTIAHLEGNRRFADLIDLTIAAYDELAKNLADDGRVSDVASVYVGIDDVSMPHPDLVAKFREEAGLHEGERLVLYVGRLAAEKRPEWVTRLATELRPEEARVGIIGDGPLREDIAKAVRENDRLVWMSELDSVEPALAAADLVVLPSRIEGIPLVAMEALALGTPVVATRVGGLPDLENEEGITLTDPEDFDAFVEAVRKNLDVDSERVHLSKRFSAKAMLEEYDRLLFGDQ